MAKQLCSVGLDVGTTTTQLIVSQLTVENRASAFTVPEMTIAQRKILYQSPVHFTPLLDDRHVDGQRLRQMVEAEYQNAGITRQSVDTGAIIITGESSRKENARAVLTALSDLAGEFVVATAGPDLESILAARGAGAVEFSAKTGKTVLHMDIGGGTSNLALIEDGKIIRTGCLNVGGRLIKLDGSKVTYVSPVLSGLTALKPGDVVSENQIAAIAEKLTAALEMAAGLRPADGLLEKLWTKEVIPNVIASQSADWRGNPPDHREHLGRLPRPFGPRNDMVISFSGGVADCIETVHPPFAFGDMGPMLGQAIRSSRLCQREYMLGQHTIRATVIGAGCHSTQLSGSTVYHRNIQFPLKNLPVITLSAQEQKRPDWGKLLCSRFAAQDATAVLALEAEPGMDYPKISALADGLAECIPSGPVYVTAGQDLAKALGQALALRLSPDRPVLCLDQVALKEGSYLDVGEPIGPALPVVIKTLILSNQS